MTIKNREIEVSLGQLMLDPNNYRLNKGEEFETYSDDDVIDLQDEIQEKLISENISDLERSILKNGFLEVDKIVVRELHDSNGDSEFKKYLVIEGNRRTAAFKSIISEYYNDNDFDDDFPEMLKTKYQSINVILVEGSLEEIQDYSQRLMGIRHVSGPRPWGGYQSAKLINDMVSQGYKKIGTLLGMRPHEAQRRHEAYLAIQQMKSDEIYSEYANPKLFTLFSEIVSSNKYFKEEWLGWCAEDKFFKNTKNLHRVYRAILPDQEGYLEINNPSKLRFFAKCINKEEVRLQIEQGVTLDDIDYDFDQEARIKKINAFIKFSDKLNELTDEEKKLFIELREVISDLISSEEA
ncbi:hypothetical protein U9608_002970 [Vibrio alginolyticus]|nr:hypothetical protein [Vibrio alginolyticus]